MEDQIFIKQINLQHCKGATSLISKHLNSMQTKKQNLVVLIQEPWINKNIIQGFDTNKVDLFYNREGKQKPRTCIVMTKGLKATIMPQYSSGDITTIVVNIHNGNSNEELLLTSLYMPYEEQNTIPCDTAKEVIEFSTSSGIPIIIGADCNAHHILWGSSDTNGRGEKLVEYLATTSLDILNKGNEPTFVNKLRQEVLDVTLTTQQFSDRIKNWMVSNEETLSDHREINFQISCVKQPETLYRNPRNTDWSTFVKVLQSRLRFTKHLSTIESTEDIDNAVCSLTKALHTAFMRSCPGRISKPRKNNWWNSELEKLKLESRRLFRVAKASKGSINEQECWLALRKCRNLYTKEIRKAQAESWTNFCNSIEGATSTARLHKVLAKDPAKEPGILKKADGSYTSDSIETAQLLLNTHFPGNVPLNEPDMHSDANHNSDSRNYASCNSTEMALINDIVTYDRVKWAIHSFDKYKSPGFDNIYPIMLQKGWELIGKHIVHIYKQCIARGHVPNKWNEVKVIFIPKPGKEDYTSPKSYRPISLTSTLLKGMERLIDRHLKDVLATSNQLHSSQHAFQQGKSTETALHEIVSHIEDTFAKKEYLIAVFLDIAGAFDNVSFDAVIRSIENRKFSTVITSWIKYMLSHRKITFETGSEKLTVQATRGTPQGGVLSPTLWVIVMDKLLCELHRKGFTATGYADDLTIECRGKYLDTISDRLQQALKIVEKWCMEVGLTVHPDKSELVIYTKNKKLDGFKEPKIFGKEISRHDSAKYLGVILDSRLNWKKHIDYRIGKCIRIFWCCRKAIGKSWGLAPKSIMWIYTAIVKPLLAYGSYLWWRGTESTYPKSKLNHLQRTACLAITGAMCTTPQAAMEALLFLPKLDDHIKAEAKNTAYRLRDNISDLQRMTADHTKILNELYEHNLLLQAKSDSIPIKYNFDKNFEVHIHNKEDWVNGHVSIDFYSHVYFTDGAVSADNSGYGALYARDHTVIKGSCGKEATITQAEIAAIHACCIDARQKRLDGKISIYSDSLGALNALNSYEIKSGLTLECVEMLNKIAENAIVNLFWIPAHSGFYGNEVADRIAKFAAREHKLSVEPQIAMVKAKVRKTTDFWLASQAKISWATTRGCDHTKYFLKNMDDRITSTLLNMSKENIRIITGFLTGHCKVNSHLARLRIRDDPDCDLCGDSSETARHLLCECSNLTSIREQIFDKAWLTPKEICEQPLINVVTFYRRCSETNNHISRAFQTKGQ